MKKHKKFEEFKAEVFKIDKEINALNEKIDLAYKLVFKELRDSKLVIDSKDYDRAYKKLIMKHVSPLKKQLDIKIKASEKLIGTYTGGVVTFKGIFNMIELICKKLMEE